MSNRGEGVGLLARRGHTRRLPRPRGTSGTSADAQRPKRACALRSRLLTVAGPRRNLTGLPWGSCPAPPTPPRWTAGPHLRDDQGCPPKVAGLSTAPPRRASPAEVHGGDGRLTRPLQSPQGGTRHPRAPRFPTALLLSGRRTLRQRSRSDETTLFFLPPSPAPPARPPAAGNEERCRTNPDESGRIRTNPDKRRLEQRRVEVSALARAMLNSRAVIILRRQLILFVAVLISATSRCGTPSEPLDEATSQLSVCDERDFAVLLGRSVGIYMAEIRGDLAPGEDIAVFGRGFSTIPPNAFLRWTVLEERGSAATILDLADTQFQLDASSPDRIFRAKVPDLRSGRLVLALRVEEHCGPSPDHGYVGPLGLTLDCLVGAYDVVSHHAGPTEPPLPPAQLSVIPLSPWEVRLEWAPSEGAHGYALHDQPQQSAVQEGADGRGAKDPDSGCRAHGGHDLRLLREGVQ